jgi:hypothetical protein
MKSEIPQLTQQMIDAGAEVLRTWHRYNSEFETEKDCIKELWDVWFGHAEN